MATTSELVLMVSEALGVPRSTVDTHMRNLRGAGLLTKSGRGPSAARMTVQDAATLLVAVLASPQIQDSVETANLCLNLQCLNGPQVRDYAGNEVSDEMLSSRFQVERSVLGRLPAGHTLMDGLVALFGMTDAEDQANRRRLFKGDTSQTAPLRIYSLAALNFEVRAALPGGKLTLDGQVLVRFYIKAMVARPKGPRPHPMEVAVYPSPWPKSRGPDVDPDNVTGARSIATGDMVSERSISQRAIVDILSGLAR